CKNIEPHCHMEAPPWMIGGGGNWRGYFMTDGSNSYECSAPYDLIGTDHIDIRHNGTGPVETSARTGPTPCTSSSGQDWRRNYYGIWSAQYIDHPEEGAVSLGFLHGENKYDCSSGCPGTVNPRLASYGNTYCPIDYAPTYASFVCASWTRNNAGSNWGQQYFPNDLGPITWPSSGYLSSSGQKTSRGVGQPSSIQYNGYLYVFYHDKSNYTAPGDPPVREEEGRRAGIKVVRALISDALDPNAYEAFYEDKNGNQSWVPSLPQGFKKEEIQHFFTVPGPLATNLMGGDDGSYEERFSVAQVRNTNYFIGVESYLLKGRWCKALRYSGDLLHWTGRMRILEDVNSWDQSEFCYPIFLSKDGWSNTVVDADDFYILGTGSVITNVVNKLHVHLMPQIPGLSAAMISASVYPGSGTIASPAVYPNPSYGIFKLVYSLDKSARTQVNVLDMTGTRIFSGEPVTRLPGDYSESIDMTGHARGIYLVELVIGGERKTLKVFYN
ncbi:MAG TPA: T9SS type A sorting domain-containing protein, partial [Puia sp.]